MFRAVLVGCGLIAVSHARALEAIENAELAGVCDINLDAAERIAGRYGVPAFTDCAQMLETVRPDFAVICVPTFLHGRYAALCAGYGVDVLCEKPLERRYETARRLMEDVGKSGVVFMTAQVVRFWPGYDRIKAMLDAGELGTVYMASLRRASARSGQYGTWMFRPEQGGGALHDTLVHDVDFLRHLFGPFESCFANATKDDTGCYNHVMANIRHKNGVHALAEASMTMQTGYPFSFSILLAGSKATVEYRYSAGATIADREGEVSEFRVWRLGRGLEVSPVAQADAYETQMRYFVSCCEKRVQPEVVPHQENLEVMRMIDLLEQSADTGRAIEFPA